MSATGTIFDVEEYAIYDGPGIRTCIYVKGCPLRCAWCHNPESQRTEPEPAVCPTGGLEVIGRERSVAELVSAVVADRPFFDRSGGGVTITGGEPTSRPRFLLELLAALAAEGLHTAVDTCGHFPPDLCEPLAAKVDLFLFDIKHVAQEAHLRATGVDGRRIFANFTTLLDLVGPERLRVRIPVIPDFNCAGDDMGAIVDALTGAGYRAPVDLMPYHAWASGKYERLGRGHELQPRRPLTEEDRARVTAVCSAAGLDPCWQG